MDESQLPTEGASTATDPQPEQQQEQQNPAAAEPTDQLPVSTTGENMALNHGDSINTHEHHQISSSHDFSSSVPDYAHPESDQLSRFNSSPTMNYQPQNQSASRPGSGLSGAGDKYMNAQQPFAESGQKSSVPASRNSVVIKVGMVGDAQIGKTSLMVKYVEGSWDEDYIQTLGESSTQQNQNLE